MDTPSTADDTRGDIIKIRKWIYPEDHSLDSTWEGNECVVYINIYISTPHENVRTDGRLGNAPD